MFNLLNYLQIMLQLQAEDRQLKIYCFHISFDLILSIFFCLSFIMVELQLIIRMQYLSLFLALLLVLSQSKPKLTLGAGGFGFGCGSNSPAAQVPYSFVRLGPDTAPLIKKQYMNFQHFGGYSDSDRYLRAFSHLHLVGAGVIDLGVFGILPTKAYKKDSPPKDQRVILFKDTEYAQPGYYKVDIQHNITVELTTSQRVGVHRYIFHSKGPHQINVMTGFLLAQKTQRNSTTKICGEKCLEGTIHALGSFGGRFGGYNLYYHLQWHSDGQDQLKLFNDSSVDKNSKQMKGQNSGCIIISNSAKIEMFMGISYVSIQNAKLNYQQQIKGKGFDQLKQQSINIWAKEFSRFEISAITQDYQTKIDTAIYRTMLTPTLFNDFNGEYPSFKNDGSVSIVPDDMENVYTDMSLWDVHRTQMPWLLLQDPKRFRDIAKSLVLINREGGYMPKWPFAQGWTGCMIGAHANTILADWITKEAKKDKRQNISEVFSYMLRNANTHTPHDSRPQIDFYKSYGYIPFENNERSACGETLELSFNDYSISQVAQLLNQTDYAKDFKNRSLFYKNVWNNQTKFFQPKYKNGSFYPLGKNERLNVFSNHYVEGNAWHYRFAVPHGGQQLINLFGGNQSFVKQLSKFFQYSKYWPTLWLPNPYYWAGNEHDLFSVWLFSFADRQDLTSKYSRMIMRSSYGVQGNGLPGNDDYATMSAWFIFAGLGFYPLPSSQTYILGSPIVHSARIYRRMQDGSLSPFNIRVNKNSERQWRVQSVNLNGNIVDKFITHQQLTKSNSMLTFSMKL